MSPTYKKGKGTEGTEGTASTGGSFSGSPGEKDQGTEGTISILKPIKPQKTPPADPAEPEIDRPCYATHDDWFQSGGNKRRPGLYWHDFAKDGEPVDDWICTPIHAEAMTQGEQGDQHGLMLRFMDSHGKWCSWAMPMQMLKGGGEEMRGELLDRGARIDPKKHWMLSAWLMGQHPTRCIVATRTTGWHANGKAFVTPHLTIGEDDVRFQSEHASNDDYRQGGTLSGWREEVAGPCRGNPMLLLAVSVAFAGPLLLRARQMPSGGHGIHLMGDSSKGKTTCLQVAASVWGGPDFVRTWRATANGLEANFAALNDTLAVMDEISECDPREIGGAIYAMGNGQGKTRMRRQGTAKRPSRWRITVLSSGERSLATHMAEARVLTKAGQHARLLDVPATSQAHGAFDDLKHYPDGRAFADALKQFTREHHGHAGQAFIENLLSDDSDLPAKYAETCGLLCFQGRDPLESRAGGVFALIAMAGEKATEYGITGWEEGEALEAAITAFKGWQAFRGEGQTETQQILNSIRDFIDRHGDSRFSNFHAEDRHIVIRDRAGYWRGDAGDRIWMFNKSGLLEAGGGQDMRRILEALDSAEWIDDHEKGKRSKGVKINGRKVLLYHLRIDGEVEQ